MKKMLFALLVGVMMIGTASIAAAEVTVGGSLEVRYDLWNNLTLNRMVTVDNTQNFFAERILLNVDAKVAEGLEGYVELVSSNGDVSPIDERGWGFDGGINDNASVSAMNYEGERMAVKQAWINFMIPGAPVGIKIGHQPLALGHGIFLDSHRMGQDAILIYSKPIPELLVAGVYVKSLENSSTVPSTNTGVAIANTHKDVDVYAALANYTWMENNTVGVFYLYGHDATNVPGVLDRNGNAANVAKIHDLGMTMDGAIAGINYKGEVDYQNINANGGGIGFGVNNAWAAMLGGSYNVMNIATVGMDAAYGSGTSGNGRFGSQQYSSTATGPRTFQNPYGTTSYNYAFLYNDKIGQGMYGTGAGLGLGDGTGGFGLANTSYLKLTVGATPMDRLNVGLDFLYLRASASSYPTQSRDLGWEVDANVGYKIYDNLKLDVNGGVFVPGAWYAFQGRPSNVGTAVNTLTDPTNASSPIRRQLAFGAETKLTLNF